MLRLDRSGMYRLIAAKQLESIKIGRCSADSVALIRLSQLKARGWNWLRRGRSDLVSRRRRKSRRGGRCALDDPLWTTADVAAFLCPVQTIPTRSDPLP